jgi:hypothetical protein
VQGIADTVDQPVDGIHVAVPCPLDELALHGSPGLCAGRLWRPITEM